MAGRDPLAYLATMAAMASPGGMLPEQVWDAEPIPARRLEFARPTGSAMPLAWAHAEFVKLLVSRHLGYPMDRPRAVWARYGKGVRRASEAFWWLHAPIAGFPAGAHLVIAAPHPICVRWGTDGWQDVRETGTEDTGLGFHAATLATQDLPAGACVDFTTRCEETGAWLGRDIRVVVLPDR
jgi:glucoamylase